VLGDEVAVVADDDDQVVRDAFPGGGHRVLDERPAADGVQHLGTAGPHSRPLARREDENGGRAEACVTAGGSQVRSESGNDLRGLGNRGRSSMLPVCGIADLARAVTVCQFPDMKANQHLP
jgi:hypothetical protein